MFKTNQLLYIERILIGGESNIYNIQQKCKEINLYLYLTEFPTITITSKFEPVIKIRIDLESYNFSIDVCTYSLVNICHTVNKILIVFNIPKRLKVSRGSIYVLNDDSSFVNGIVYETFDSNVLFNLHKTNKYNDREVNKSSVCNDCKYFGNNPYIYCSISPFGFNNTGCIYTPNE